MLLTRELHDLDQNPSQTEIRKHTPILTNKIKSKVSHSHSLDIQTIVTQRVVFLNKLS